MTPKTITIIGLGLMGGSLAAACRKSFPKSKIIGVSRSRKALQVAKKRKWIHEGHLNVSVQLSSTDLVVIATPVQTISDQLKKLDRFLKHGTLATDVGSVKAVVCKKVARLKLKNIRFIGAHPMVGSHMRGIGAVNPKLYGGGYTFLIKEPKQSKQAYVSVKRFWKKISPVVYEVNPAEHDKIVSQVSHLPHAMAMCLILSIGAKEMRFAAKGIADTTRVAAGDPSIWLPILEANNQAIFQSLCGFEARLKQFKKALQKKDYKTLQKLLKLGQKKRLQISI